MPMAFSGGNVALAYFNGPDTATIGDKTLAYLKWCGWEIESTTPDGYRLQCVSPQGMNVFLYIEDLGHSAGLSFNPTLTFRFTSITGDVVGQDQEIEIGASDGYELWCNQCSIFLAKRGVAFDSGGGSICGGIPFVPGGTTCNEKYQAETVSQAFWSMGDFLTGVTPRRDLITRNDQKNSEACLNGNYSPGNVIASSVRIPAITVSSQIFNGLNFPSRTIWYTYDELFYEPFLVWGMTSGVQPRLRGQIYDVVVHSKARPLEERFTADNFPFINWTDNWQYGGVGLLLATLDPNAGNTLQTRV